MKESVSLPTFACTTKQLNQTSDTFGGKFRIKELGLMESKESDMGPQNPVTGLQVPALNKHDSTSSLSFKNLFQAGKHAYCLYSSGPRGSQHIVPKTPVNLVCNLKNRSCSEKLLGFS